LIVAAVKRPTIECDRRILIIVIFLMAIGVSLVASSSSHFSTAKFDDPYFLLKRHLVRIIMASLFLLLAMHIDYRVFRRLSPIVFAIGLCLLLGLFIFGHAIRDTVRWYHVKSLQVTVQPGEVARFALVLFLAYWVARKGKEIERFKSGFLPAAIAVLLVVGLMAAQPNYGTASATVLIAFLMLFLGGVRLRHLTLLGTILVGTALIRVSNVEYVRNRLLAFAHPEEGFSAANWQPYQSLIALGTGGLFGSGFGGSRQNYPW
jgi:cell division protein FtsW